MAKLVISRGPVIEQEVELDGRTLRIGRSDQNDVVLQDPTKAVSRNHAELWWENDRYLLTDRGSENGLWVNGRRMQRVVLDPSEPVTVGPFTLTLILAAPSTAVAEQSIETSRDPTYTDQPRYAPDVRPEPHHYHPRPAPPMPVRSKVAVSRSLVFAAIAFVVVALAAAQVVFERGPSTIADVPQNPPAETQRDANVPPAPPPDSATRITTMLNDAQKLLDAKDFRGARLKLEEVNAIDASNAAALDLLHQLDQAEAVSIAPPRTPDGATIATTEGPPKPPRPQPPKPPTPQELEMAAKYDTAKAAADRDAIEDAHRQFSDLDRGYKDVAAQLGALVGIMHNRAEGAVAQARRLEAAGELADAGRDYRTASAWLDVMQRRQVYGSAEETLSNAVKQSLAQLDERIRAEGDAAFERGKTEYNFRRYTVAIPLLERAYKLLPESDPRKKQTKEWLDASRAK